MFVVLVALVVFVVIMLPAVVFVVTVMLVLVVAGVVALPAVVFVVSVVLVPGDVVALPSVVFVVALVLVLIRLLVLLAVVLAARWVTTWQQLTWVMGRRPRYWQQEDGVLALYLMTTQSSAGVTLHFQDRAREAATMWATLRTRWAKTCQQWT